MKFDSSNRSHSSTNLRPTCADASREASAVTTPPPFLIKKILVPVDFSDHSAKAIHYAIPFAGQCQVQMIFLHVLPVKYSALMDQESGPSDPLIDGDTWKQLEARLAELVRENVPTGISTKLLLRYGSPAIEIMSAAREFEVDMIIMATQGLTGRAHSLIGSVASDVTRLAPCPVLVVHKREREYMTGTYDPRTALPHATGYAATTTTTTGTA